MRAWLGVVVVVAVALGSCSSSDDSDASGDVVDTSQPPTDASSGDEDQPAEPETITTLVFDLVGDPADTLIDAKLELLRERLADSGVGGEVTRAADQVEVVARTPLPVPADRFAEFLAQPSLRFMPVEASGPVDTPVSCAAASAAEPGSGVVLRDDELWWCLGAVGADGGAVESAAVRFGDGAGWVVDLVFRPGSPGIDDFNVLAAECSARLPTCPSSQLAIVVEGEVITAPIVNRTLTISRYKHFRTEGIMPCICCNSTWNCLTTIST